MHLKYWMAELWPRLYPIVNKGDQYDIMQVYKQLKQYPQDEIIVQVLIECCIVRLNSYGIDHNFVY